MPGRCVGEMHTLSGCVPPAAARGSRAPLSIAAVNDLGAQEHGLQQKRTSQAINDQTARDQVAPTWRYGDDDRLSCHDEPHKARAHAMARGETYITTACFRQIDVVEQ